MAVRKRTARVAEMRAPVASPVTREGVLKEVEEKMVDLWRHKTGERFRVELIAWVREQIASDPPVRHEARNAAIEGGDAA